jgi:hypothetical protein
MDDYKRRAMTGHQSVCQGSWIGNPVRRRMARSQGQIVAAVKASPVAPALRRAVRAARRA